MAESLAAILDIRITVIAPSERPRVWPASLDAITDDWIVAPTDVGVVQTDDVTVDFEETGRRVNGWLRDADEIAERERRRLDGRFDLVVGDVPPIPFAAADSLGIPSVAVANFTWDWIYRELGFATAAERAASSYSRATLLLEALPSGPMPAFPHRRNIGLVSRAPSSSRESARAHFGLAAEDTAVLIAFQPAFSDSMSFPPPRDGRRFFVPPGWPATDRPDVVPLAAGRGFEDAMAAADVVVGKPGYGLIGDVEKSGARFLYVPRPGFPENAVLEKHLAARDGTMAIRAAELRDPAWERRLQELEIAKRPAAKVADGADRAAAEIVRVLAVDSDAREV